MIHYDLPPTLKQDFIRFEKDLLYYQRGDLHETAFTAKRVKMGVYRERGDQTYMCRIRCAGGIITPKQLAMTAGLAKKYGSPRVHVTTRSEVQIHGVSLGDVIPVMVALETVNLSMKGGGGHTIRNIYSNPDSGTNPNEVFDVQPHVLALTSRLISEPDSFELPRKFKMAFSSLPPDVADYVPHDSGFCKLQDLGFIARLDEEGKKGFEVYAGGGLGAMPKVGVCLHDFLPEEKVFHVVRAMKNLFHTHGNRRRKNHSRIRFLIHDDLGEEKFRALYQEELDKICGNESLLLDIKPIDNAENQSRQIDMKPVLEDMEGFESWYERKVSPQKQEGLFSIQLPLDLGDLDCEDCFRLEEILRPFGDNVLRCGSDQNFYIRNIPKSFLKNAYKGIRTLRTLTDKPGLFGRIVPCTGAQTCQLGINFPRPATTAIFDFLDKTDLDYDALEEISIQISGCPNACANHWAGDLGFFGRVRHVHGRPIPTYNVLGGAWLKTGEAKLGEDVGWVHSRDLPRFLAGVLKQYQDYKRAKKEKVNFNRFWQDGGKVRIGQLCKNHYNLIPAFESDKNYYFDHGATELFSTKNIMGTSECSAGIYDMIEVDKKAIQKNLKVIGARSNDRPGLDTLLKETLFFASRMLLVTRGEEPRTEKETYDLFLKHFIATGLLDKNHRVIIETVRNGKPGGLLKHKDQVIALGEAITALYKGMDDTMRFPGETENLTLNMEAKRQSEESKEGSASTDIGKESHIKNADKFIDLRGVKCPINFVKTKIAMAAMKSGEILGLWLDDGEPVDNVPRSVKLEGHKVLNQEKVGEYWTVLIEKA